MSLTVLAAGSLRAVWPALASAYGQPIRVAFGPAGLLCERIKQGERCDMFLSANTLHPQSLLAAEIALDSATFAHNRLCLSVPPPDRNEAELAGAVKQSTLARCYLYAVKRSFRRLCLAAY